MPVILTLLERIRDFLGILQNAWIWVCQPVEEDGLVDRVGQVQGFRRQSPEARTPHPLCSPREAPPGAEGLQLQWVPATPLVRSPRVPGAGALTCHTCVCSVASDITAVPRTCPGAGGTGSCLSWAAHLGQRWPHTQLR